VNPFDLIFRVFLPLLPWVVFFIVVVAIAMLVKRFLVGGKRKGAPALPQVQLNKKFISYAEVEFFRVLQQIVGGNGLILAQVSLKQLLYFPGNNQTNPGRRTWQNKVAQRCVDFVIVDPKSLRPILVIELNDRSHEQEDRILRDAEVKAILQAAGVPFLPIPQTKTYDRRDLAVRITELTRMKS
jgi:very-short-patch-repair endonuclease